VPQETEQQVQKKVEEQGAEQGSLSGTFRGRKIRCCPSIHSYSKPGVTVEVLEEFDVFRSETYPSRLDQRASREMESNSPDQSRESSTAFYCSARRCWSFQICPWSERRPEWSFQKPSWFFSSRQNHTTFFSRRLLMIASKNLKETFSRVSGRCEEISHDGRSPPFARRLTYQTLH